MSEKVSIIIPAYNKAALTVKTVESVLKQTYSPIEIIVVDDGSSDNTKEALLPFQNKIRYVYKQNGGACSARNVGIKMAQGEFIGLLDCDDQYLPNKVELCVDYLRKNPNAGFVHTAAYFIDHNENILSTYSHPKSKKPGHITRQLILGNFVCNSTPLIRKKAIDEAGLFDESIFAPADWDMWLRISERYEVGYIDQPLTKYRVTDNYTFTKLQLSQKEEFFVVEKFFSRNSRQFNSLKRKALSNYHLRYAQCHFLKNDLLQVKKELGLSVSSDPLNMKAYGMLLLFRFRSQWLKSYLGPKISRTSAPC